MTFTDIKDNGNQIRTTPAMASPRRRVYADLFIPSADPSFGSRPDQRESIRTTDIGWEYYRNELEFE